MIAYSALIQEDVLTMSALLPIFAILVVLLFISVHSTATAPPRRNRRRTDRGYGKSGGDSGYGSSKSSGYSSSGKSGSGSRSSDSYDKKR